MVEKDLCVVGEDWSDVVIVQSFKKVVLNLTDKSQIKEQYCPECRNHHEYHQPCSDGHCCLKGRQRIYSPKKHKSVKMNKKQIKEQVLKNTMDRIDADRDGFRFGDLGGEVASDRNTREDCKDILRFAISKAFEAKDKEWKEHLKDYPIPPNLVWKLNEAETRGAKKERQKIIAKIGKIFKGNWYQMKYEEDPKQYSAKEWNNNIEELRKVILKEFKEAIRK